LKRDETEVEDLVRSFVREQRARVKTPAHLHAQLLGRIKGEPIALRSSPLPRQLLVSAALLVAALGLSLGFRALRSMPQVSPQASASHPADLQRAPSIQAQIIAGSIHSSRPFAGNDGPALQASLDVPRVVAADSYGNLYVADNLDAARPADVGCQVREIVAATGIIRAIAGTGFPGTSGDGGSATRASIGACGGIAVDRAGNVFVSDATNGLVREIVATDGSIKRIAGGGTITGDRIRAVDASLYGPQGLAVDDQGNLYVADTGHNRVVMIDRQGLLSTVAGDPSTGVAGDSGDGGAATRARLNQPYGVGFDSSGNLLIADTGNGAVRLVTASKRIRTVAGGRSGALLDHPHAVAGGPWGIVVAAGSLHLIAQSGREFQLQATGDQTSMFADGLAVGPGGEVFVADTIHQLIWKVTLSS
jgi:sugar lactone lactonase YvrE